MDQIRIVFLSWLPYLLRMSRPGSEITFDCSLTPVNNEKVKQINEVELRER